MSSSMSGINMASLELAKHELISSSNSTNIERALTTISEASADLGLRPSLQETDLFGRLLELYANIYSLERPPQSLLRSIGNLVSDNERNRSSLVGSTECMQALRTLLTHYTPYQGSTELEDFAVKIFFNLCNESPDTEQKALEQGVHEAALDYINKRNWSEADDVLLGVAVGLLAGLIEHKPTDVSSGEYTADFTEKVLKLPLMNHLDSDSFLDTLNVASVYLQDEKFVLQTVENKRLHLVWDVLARLEDVMQRECSTDGDADEEDEKQYRQFLNAVAQSLANMSSLSAFNDSYTLEDDFIKDLGRRCIPSNDLERKASLLPGCACLVLGNLAISDDVSIALASNTVSVDQLSQHLGTSNESVFLNAAAGLLRHLAIPMSNRERFFDNSDHLRNAAHLYTDVTLEQIQIAGLQLTRQILTAMPERVQRFIGQEDDVSRPTLTTFLDLFTQTTSTATKLEIARLVTTLLRALQAPLSVEEANIPLKKLISTPIVLSPLISAIKQPSASGVMHVQAEAWLALNLFVRVPGGAGILASEVAQDEQMFSLLRTRIIATADTVVEVKDEPGEAIAEDTRPTWLKEKERDNAVLLIHDILKADEVDGIVKSILKELLNETDYRVR